MQESEESVTMEKGADDDAEYIATFEETLKRFMGLSSEEIWELQRILVRRVRCKISESLSPEGKTAMKQVKQEMHERQLELQKMAMSSATLVTELFDFGSRTESHIPRQNGEGTGIVLTVADDIDQTAETKSHQDDEIEQVANMNVTETSEASVKNETTEDDVSKDNVAAADAADEVVEERRHSRSSSRCSSRHSRKGNNIGGTTDQLEAETEENNKQEVTSSDVPKADDTSKGLTDSQENPDISSGQKSSEETGTDADNQGTLSNDEKNSSSVETNSSETKENENVGTST